MTIWIKQGDKQKHPRKCFIYVAIISVIMGIDLFVHRVEIQLSLLLLISERLEFYDSEF